MLARQSSLTFLSVPDFVSVDKLNDFSYSKQIFARLRGVGPVYLVLATLSYASECDAKIINSQLIERKRKICVNSHVHKSILCW